MSCRRCLLVSEENNCTRMRTPNGKKSYGRIDSLSSWTESSRSRRFVIWFLKYLIKVVESNSNLFKGGGFYYGFLKRSEYRDTVGEIVPSIKVEMITSPK